MSAIYNSDFDFGDYFLRGTEFLDAHRYIFTHPNTKFVQAGVLDRLPSTWVRDLKRASNDELNQIPLGLINGEWSEDFKRFLRDIRDLSIRFEQKDFYDGKSGKLKGVNPKKLYEIENLTALIGQVCDREHILLDFGSGLGYLSQYLHEKHDFTVLGVEGDSYRVQAAQRRQSELFPKSTAKVTFVQQFIEEHSFEHIESIARCQFARLSPPEFAIVGLHACADLSLTAIKMFLSNDSVTRLVIMPCCYHKLKPQDENCSRFNNIPISEQLKHALKSVPNFLGRPFLRLGCQQTSARWKNMTKEEHDSHGRAMFERSLVEAVLDAGEFVTVNKNISKVDSVLDRYLVYNQSAPKVAKPWTEEHREKLRKLEEKYTDGGQMAEFLTCAQTCLQSICENLILLDRMCYIKTEAAQRGLRVRSNLVKFANDQLSPRCFVIIVEKLSTKTAAEN